MFPQLQIILPIFILITILTLNIWLLRYLHANLRFGSNIRSQSLLSDRNGSTGSRNGTPSSVPVTGISSMYRPLLGCAAVYFLTQFPAILVNTLRHLGEPPLGWALEKFQPVAWSLTAVNYSVNFLVYAGLSRHYRALLVNLFQGRLSSGRCSDAGTAGLMRRTTETSVPRGNVERALFSRVRGSLQSLNEFGRPSLCRSKIRVPSAGKAVIFSTKSSDV